MNQLSRRNAPCIGCQLSGLVSDDGHPVSRCGREPGSSGDREYRFPKCLARTSSGVDTDSTDQTASLNQSGTLSELGRLHGRSLPGRAAPDAEQVVIKHVSRLFHELYTRYISLVQNVIPSVLSGCFADTTLGLFLL